MKNILIFIFILSPLFLFSQTWGTGITVSITDTTTTSEKSSLVDDSLTVTDESQGILSVGDGGMIITNPVHEITLPYITTSRSTNPYVNTLELQQGRDKGIIFEGQTTPLTTTKIVYSDWLVETAWKPLNKGRIDNCQEHNWLNASEKAGNYNTTKFEIGLSKGDMLQECRICVKCKRLETQLTFMGTGTNPFIWEVTQSIYQQLLDEKK